MMATSNVCPDSVVLRGRTAPFESFLFEVRDLDNGELLLKEPPERIASWLSTCGYSWVYGSSGVWQRTAKAGIPQPVPPQQRPERLNSGEGPSLPAGAA
jgi:hypothetical protein